MEEIEQRRKFCDSTGNAAGRGNHCKCGEWNMFVANTHRSRILQRAKPPKSNLTFGERTAVKTLNQDKEILVLPADKGNAMIISTTTNGRSKPF